MQATGDSAAAARRSTVAEGLYSGLVSSPFASAHAMQGQMEAKLKLLVEAPAAVEDALASLLNHVDSAVQVCLSCMSALLTCHLFLACQLFLACLASLLNAVDFEV